MVLEVCVDSVESALAAEEGGAARVELCADLDHGGTTPEPRLIESVRERLSITLHVMIRPRPGDFCYSVKEIDEMMHDVEQAKAMKVDGVVIGVLTDRGEVDEAKMRKLLDLARPLSVTFHRAFDEAVNLRRALENLKMLGVDRVLTSGGHGNILQNVALLGELVRMAGGRPLIMAGGGVNFGNVKEIVETSEVNEIHTLSAVLKEVRAAPPHSKPSIASVKVVDSEKVKRMVHLLGDISSYSQSWSSS